MIAALALLATAPQSAMEPMKLFQDVCQNGRRTLKQTEAIAFPLSALPHDAEANFRDVVGGDDGANVGPLKNTVYQLRFESEAFLLLPATDAQDGRPVDRSCAVVVRGDHIVLARRAVLARPVQESDFVLPLPANQQAMGPFNMTWGGYHATAWATHGWTGVAATPVEAYYIKH